MAAVAALGLMTGGAAQAAVTYNFIQTSAQPIGSVFVSGSLTVTDAAFASGFTLVRSYNSRVLNNNTTNLTGLENVSITASGNGLGFTRTVDLNTLFWTGLPDSGLVYSLNLTAAANGLLNGSILYRTSSDEIALTVTNGAFSGYGLRDIAGACPGGVRLGSSGITACGFTGVTNITATPVPEPATLALFGIGLAGLAAIRRQA